MIKKNLKTLVRILVSGIILWLIARSIDLGQVLDNLRGASPGLLLLALVLQGASIAAAAYRWFLVMRNLDYPLPRQFYIRSYFKGMFFNQGLPTSVGGDALRVLDVASQGYRKRDAFAGVLVDRGIGLAALMLLNVLALLASPGLLPGNVTWGIAAMVSIGLTGFLAVLVFARLRWVENFSQLRLLRILSFQLQQAFSRQGLFLVMLSLLIHMLTVACIYTIGLSLDMHYSLLTYLVIVPPVILFTVIPVSVAGWGVREGAMVTLFALIGADKAAVLAMSIIFGLILIAASVPGLLVYLQGRHHAPLQDKIEGDR